MSSEPDLFVDTEDEGSINSSHSTQRRISVSSSRPIMSHSPPQNNSAFGSELQKYAKDLIKSLSNFKFSEELTDANYISWSQAVSELFQSIDLDKFLTKQDHTEDALTPSQNEKRRFIITTFILNRLDANNSLRARNHLTNPSDPHVLV